MKDPPEDCPDESDRGEPLLDPIVEHSRQRDGEPVGSAVIGGFVYEGDALPDLKEVYVFGDVSRQYDEPEGRPFAAIPSDNDDKRALRSIGSRVPLITSSTVPVRAGPRPGQRTLRPHLFASRTGAIAPWARFPDRGTAQ